MLIIQQNVTIMLLLSGDNMFKRKEKELKERIEKQKKELEEQKQIAAKHVSMYYDVVQKLKTVMEETNYGQNL